MAKKTVIFEVWPLAFADGLKGVIKQLDHMRSLGVTHVWLSGILTSPQYDHGYDVSDFYSIEPRLGTLDDFDALVSEAHRRGIGVLIDLILNHTSVHHAWFREHSCWYCWESYNTHSEWESLFGGPAWKYDGIYDQYYLHLFHEKQADLNWFPEGELNQQLVKEARKFVRFWVELHRVDGFRIDALQGINKDLNSLTLKFKDLISGDKAVEVINAIFPAEEKAPFLVAELFDPSYGGIIDYYLKNTQISFAMNVMLKDAIDDSDESFLSKLDLSTQSTGFMLDMESHDSPRFLSRTASDPQQLLLKIFNSKVDAVCIYQGEEYGFKNPTMAQLSNEGMLRLDAQTANRYAQGESLASLRDKSRANARADYYRQFSECQDAEKFFEFFRTVLTAWKHGRPIRR